MIIKVTNFLQDGYTMKFRIYVRRVMDLENVYAWRVNVHKMIGQEKEMHSGEI